MNKKFNLAVQKINNKGILLVFPIKNAKEPSSLWSELYPRSAMNWEWSEDGDDRVMKMWGLMKQLSNCGEVVYSKWYKGRATFFSKELFIHLLAYTRQWRENSLWNSTTEEMYEIMQNDSPLSTKILKRYTGLVGKDFNAEYERSLKFLFQRLYIVSFGEVEDGAFPSSAIGATSLLFEDLWLESESVSDAQAKKKVNQYMPEGTEFRKFLNKLIF